MPQQADNPKIIDRVRKLLARTVERGATEPEMQASVALAARLMDKYCISRSEVEPRESAHGLLQIWSGPALPPEMDFLTTILVEHFHVRVVYHRTGRGVSVSAYGTQAHRQVANHVFNMLLQTYRRLWMQYRTSTTRRRREGRMLSYYLGLTGGLYGRLRDQRGRAERAIVRTNVACDVAFSRDLGELGSEAERKFNRVPAAVQAGYAASDQIDIHPAVAAG